jgi:hypothetical protein
MASMTQTMDEIQAQKAALQRDTDTLREVHSGLTETIDRVREDFAARAQAEQQEQQRLADLADKKRIQDYVDSFPDPEAPDPFVPSGELHDLPPSHPRHEEELAALSDQGNLPRRLEKGGPPTLGTLPTPDPSTLSHPQDPDHYQPQPISISLNSEGPRP